ncbi:MAG: orotidine-5'-phosphate decarboxylase [Gemmatimonadales bacterium]
MAELVVALDLPSTRAALDLVDRLPDLRWAKIGPVLYVRDGPALVRALTGRGLRVFLDLKWHDIPSTVAGAAAAARDLGVGLATVHCLGGDEMLHAAVAAAPDLPLVGVTVLTAHTAGALATALGRGSVDLPDEVVRLARLGMAAGLKGVVASPLEIAPLRRAIGSEPWIVVPGIRRTADAPGDQARTATPEAAARAGATYVVVGRPITGAVDPGTAFSEFSEAVAPR